jgi:MoxR-like ATPase
MSLERVHDKARELRRGLDTVILGQTSATQELVVAVFSGGHVLLEGPPGLGKTLLASTLARLLDARFRRIQFTPDLMPADVTGTTVFLPESGQFQFRAGPVFTEVLLADEINRTPPKTQAALLEAMQERQVTVDGESHELPGLFIVVATQNPVEYEGTYPLPEAQLDRFFMKIRIGYPGATSERGILDAHADGLELVPAATGRIGPVLKASDVEDLRRAVGGVFVDESVRDYIVRIAHASREHRRVSLGASSRAAISLLFAAKAAAACEGREFVRPDDVKAIVPAVLRHRLVLRPDAEIEGLGTDQVIDELLAGVEVHAGGEAP